jgi:hypothetical protein
MRTGIFALVGATLLAGVAGGTAGTVANTAHAGPQHPFRPLHSHPYNQNGGNWSGYVTSGSGFSTVSATWTEPNASCNSSNDLYAPWIGIDGSSSQSVEQAGVQTDCSSGSPVNSAWYEMYPQNPVYWPDSVKAGDVIAATVTRSGTSYTLKLTDQTQHWTEQTTQSYPGANASAEVIVESPTAAYPNFGTVRFSAATIDGAPLSSTSPTALDASNSAGYEDHTSAIGLSGKSFSINYLHE